MCLEFGEGQFDRVEVGRVRRQEQQPCATLFDRFFSLFSFVSGQIIKDYHITLVKGWGELCCDVFDERVAIHRPVDHPGSGEAVMAQAGNERQGFPMTMGNAGDQPFSSFCPSAKAGHFGIKAGFVNKDNFAQMAGMGTQPRLSLAPDGACGLHITAVLFTGVCGFFYRLSGAS